MRKNLLWKYLSNKLRKVDPNKSLQRKQLGKEEIKVSKQWSPVSIYIQSRKDSTINYLSHYTYHMFGDLSPYCPGREQVKKNNVSSL